MSKSYRHFNADYLNNPYTRRPEVGDWKNDWKEEEVPEIKNVYVIIDEWTDTHGSTSSEVTDNKFFLTEDEAWEALDRIAEAFHYELDPDETSIQLGAHKEKIQYEEYRIEELDRG